MLAFGVRLAWVLAVPTVPVSDFAMYRESANYLSEFGHLDGGFIYMPGFVVLLAWVQHAGGGLLAQKLLGVAFGTLGTAAMFAVAYKLLDDRDATTDAAPPPRPPGDVSARVHTRPRRRCCSRCGPPASRSRASSGPTCPPPPCWRSRSRCW